ncbi:methyltransferase family protein [Microvirga tunisiensis]|uniref:Isoprenylcysteine carboxylmethyltransferase family protein n=1 Tax=Microvirga tunisiensis TaxID=2108360 RepID=A0A5N7N199_9HYPH|nr:methyltransferase [Microvirga tunisiensis]MPR11720.1 isoprenylcysteine carboxylmethyltransferase family protein [Microvirga tunisiensis]MPR29716.1 isoprenylcysteine carboxylmethyltransferase family protein [Microvirga tunisiensis]
MHPSGSPSSHRLPHALDVLERVALVLFYSFMSWSFLSSWIETGSAATLIVLASEGTVLAFVLIRRRTSDISTSTADWLLAFAGTVLPMLVRPVADGGIVPVLACIPIMLMGFVLQISAKLTLRRSFGVIPANRGIKASGPYRFCRHPMYAGYVMTQVGFLLINPSLWNSLIYACALAIQIGRILAEERLLSKDEAYRRFIVAVPYRLVPLVF